MLTDNVSWLYAHIKNHGKAFFMRETLAGKVHLIAGNRLARRILESNTIQNEARKRGAFIEKSITDEGKPFMVIS